MATYDWYLPTTTTNYSTFVTELHNRLNETAKGFPAVDTYSNLTTGAISFRSNKWQIWSGTAWGDLAASYEITITGNAANVTGVVAGVNGGTGQSTYTVGDLLVGGATNTLTKLAAVAVNNVLISAGIGTAPAWGKIDLNNHTNTTALPVTKGGLGLTSGITGLVMGNGTAYSAAVAGTDYAAASHTHSYLSTSGGTLTGNLSLVNGTTEMSITLGSSGGYFYGNATTVGVYKAAGASFAITIASGNVSTNGSITAGNGLTVSASGITVTSGNVELSSGDLSVTGNITATGTIASTSDSRLKSNISTLESALSKVNSLRGVSYTKAGKPEIGVIAQEVELIVPEVVVEAGEYKSVAYGNLVALLIEAIKELDRKVDARTSN